MTAVGLRVIQHAWLLTGSGLVRETMHRVPVDNQLIVRARVLHLLGKRRDLRHRHVRVERSMADQHARANR